MEETKQPITVKQIALTYGVYAGFVLVIYSLLVQIMGFVTNTVAGMGSYLILVAAIVMAQKHYKQQGDGYLEYSSGLKLGTLLALISGAIDSVVMYFYVKFIDDSMKQLIIDKQYDELRAGGTPEEQIDIIIAMTEKMMQPEIMMPLGLAFFVFSGFVISLVVTAFTKNPKAPPQQL